MGEAIELQPPTPQQVSRYLEAAGPALTAVRAAVEADETLRQFLQSPLVLNIVALTYQDRPADELQTTSSREQRLALLFDGYIEQMYDHRPSRNYPLCQVRSRLSWLAESMRQRGESEFYLDRLNPDWLPSKAQRQLATLTPMIGADLAVGLVLGLVAWWFSGPGAGLALGLVGGLARVFGLASGMSGELRDRPLIERVRWAGWSRETQLKVFKGALIGAVRAGVLGALGSALAFGLLSWLRGGLSFDVPGGLALVGALISKAVGGISGPVGVLIGALVFGLVSALVGALLGALAFALEAGKTDERSSPNEGIHRSARYACFYGLGFGLVLGLADGLLVGLGVTLSVWAALRVACLPATFHHTRPAGPQRRCPVALRGLPQRRERPALPAPNRQRLHLRPPAAARTFCRAGHHSPTP